MTDVLALNSIRGKSGKDTLIGLLESEGRKVFRVAFADVLKKMCAEALAGDAAYATVLESRCHSSAKDSPFESLSIRMLPDSPYKDWLRKSLVTIGEVNAPRSMRWHLQMFGTGYHREHLGKPNVWFDMGMREVAQGLEDGSYDHVVVTDMRMANEFTGLTKGPHTQQPNPNAFSWGVPKVRTVRIVRDWFITGVDDQSYHISDIALMAHPFDALVVNQLGEPWAMLDQLKEQGVIN